MKFTRNISQYARSKRGRLAAGIAMLALGLAVIGGVALYYSLGRYGSTQLDGLNASAQGPVALPVVESGQPQIHGALMPDGSFKPIQIVAGDLDSYTGAGSPGENLPVTRPPAPVRATYAFDSEPAVRPTPGATSDTASRAASVQVTDQAPGATTGPAPDPTSDPTVERTIDASSAPAPAVPIAATVKADGRDLVYTYNAIYPGYRMHPKYWDRPWEAGADDYAYGAVKRPDGFVSVGSTQGAPRGDSPDAAQIRIPSINVDSEIKTLEIIDIGDSREYETPKHIVGRIPNTSNPGELGNGWLFGHLESPIRGEGNVFQRLPEIPALLSSGDPVYVSLLNEDGDEFLYQVSATKVVHQDDLALYDTDDSTITLVACVPRLVYDHRLLVTGKLVGIKRRSDA